MFLTPQERLEIRQLRREGKLIREIAEWIGCSTVTVGRVCRDIPAPPRKGNIEYKIRRERWKEKLFNDPERLAQFRLKTNARQRAYYWRKKSCAP